MVTIARHQVDIDSEV
ncbi:hypothetical protein [Escherichia coli]